MIVSDAKKIIDRFNEKIVEFYPEFNLDIPEFDKNILSFLVNDDIHIDNVKLNEKLIDGQKISMDQFLRLKELHCINDALNLYCNKLTRNVNDLSMVKEFQDDNKVILKIIGANLIPAMENFAQTLWNFKVDPTYHTWWYNYDCCSCPPLDNEDLSGVDRRVINRDCLLHGNDFALDGKLLDENEVIAELERGQQRVDNELSELVPETDPVMEFLNKYEICIIDGTYSGFNISIKELSDDSLNQNISRIELLSEIKINLTLVEFITEYCSYLDISRKGDLSIIMIGDNGTGLLYKDGSVKDNKFVKSDNSFIAGLQFILKLKDED